VSRGEYDPGQREWMRTSQQTCRKKLEREVRQRRPAGAYFIPAKLDRRLEAVNGSSTSTGCLLGRADLPHHANRLIDLYAACQAQWRLARAERKEVLPVTANIGSRPP
jgi:hypothetical protein